TACHNALLPGRRLPFVIAGSVAGWVQPRFAEALLADGHAAVAREDRTVVLRDPGALQPLAHSLARQGHYRWRDEAFDVRASVGGPVLTTIDRGAIPSFGLLAIGVHVNGLVSRRDGLHVWVARRADNKLLDPGKLDHLVAGGVPAGLTPEETLVKEAAEEANIPPALASRARHVGTISYAMERPEGLRRDDINCYDLELPPDFKPYAADGEVAGFELWPVRRVLDTVRSTDDFKFNVNLVLVDLFIRCGLIKGAQARRLRAELSRD
ncbi:MAG: DUF4743 domain-containing protein, partial [Acetobacteraceae bacterium]|nr:DUF4743 domain-containing protein [Acetobacteraceae bacterium]